MNTLLEAIPDETAEEPNGLEAKLLGRVLVADDDDLIRHLIIAKLAGLGYEVDDAVNGARAWKALHVKSYDLLITDNKMPEMTGLQLVQKLRSAGFELPVIIASGSVPSGLAANDAPFRFAAILPKPFSLDELIQTVAGALTPKCDLEATPVHAGA